MSLAAAHIRREEARKLLANDAAPGAVKQAQKTAKVEQSANNLEVNAREWFMRHAPNWKENRSSKIIARLKNDVFPWIGAKPIGEIAAPELLAAILPAICAARCHR